MIKKPFSKLCPTLAFFSFRSALNDSHVDVEGGRRTSISFTPAGVKGVSESPKCQAPSGRRKAIRMFSPGV